MKNNMESPQKTKNISTHDSVIPFMGVYAKEMKSA
jgi:hypothetical protein